MGQGGPLLKKTSCSDQTATATNRMHSNDLKALLYLVRGIHSEVKFLTRFDVSLDLVILPGFNAICIDFYAVVFNIHVCKWKNVYIKDLNALRILMIFFMYLFR